MLGNSKLFETKPHIEIDESRHLIKVIGHYGSTVECAKLTLLCEKYGATVLKDGYAEVPYNPEFIKDLQFINNKTYFIGLTALAAALFGLMALGGAIGGGIQAGQNAKYSNQRNSLLDEMRSYGITDEDIVDYYHNGDTWDFFNPSSWGKSGDAYDIDRFRKDLEEFEKIKDILPSLPTAPNYNEIDTEVEHKIDAEEKELEDLFNLSFLGNNDVLEAIQQNTASTLQQQLNENNAAFRDYTNQILTSNAMNNQAIAGATRYELERSQRNAISRGASAAQRLVASINSQLGTQAQSAQQSLETSNALAQQLLAQRQANTQLRSQYLDSQNQLASDQLNNRQQLTSNVANLRNKMFERKQTDKITARQMADNAYDAEYRRFNDILDSYNNNALISKYYRNQAQRNAYSKSNNSGGF